MLALQRLRIEGGDALSLGDTPYDAVAAAKAGIGEIAGTLTGGFAREALLSAGCRFVVQRVADLRPMLQRPALLARG